MSNNSLIAYVLVHGRIRTQAQDARCCDRNCVRNESLFGKREDEEVNEIVPREE